MVGLCTVGVNQRIGLASCSPRSQVRDPAGEPLDGLTVPGCGVAQLLDGLGLALPLGQQAAILGG